MFSTPQPPTDADPANQLRWDDTEQRCRAYRGAGADMVFVDGVSTMEDLRTYASRLGDIPCLYNGDSAPASEIGHLGFKVQIHRGPMYAVFKAVRETMQELKQTGRIDPARYDGNTDVRRAVADMLGLQFFSAMEQRYATRVSTQ